MRRIVLWGMSTLTALVLLFGYRTSTAGPETAGGPGGALVPIQGGSSGNTGSGSAGSGSSSSGSTGSNGTGSNGTGSDGTGSGTTGGSGDGTYTGDSADTRWGPVQVRITVSGGKVTGVAVPVYPDNNGRDQQINARALPILVQETLKAQSADIDMVSGGTVTSEGYVRSLQSALDKAGI